VKPLKPTLCVFWERKSVRFNNGTKSWRRFYWATPFHFIQDPRGTDRKPKDDHDHDPE
jgi:hypothetical protein